MLIVTISSILTFVLVYITTLDIKSSAIFAIITTIYVVCYPARKTRQYLTKLKSIKECNNFISTYIVSLSISNSIEKAFHDVTLKSSKSLDKRLKILNSNDSYQALLSLKDYFKTSNYDVFLNILSLFINNGGNILTMTMHLQEEIRHNDEILSSIHAISIRKISEFIVLWAFSIAIVLFLRFGLNNVYSMMQNTPYFNYEILFFFSFIIISFHFEISAMVNSLKRVTANV